jgi:hypothetical protein
MGSDYWEVASRQAGTWDNPGEMAGCYDQPDNVFALNGLCPPAP